MSQFFAQCAIFAIIGAIVFGLSKLLRCEFADVGIDNPARSSLHATIAVGISMSILTLLILRQFLAGNAGISSPKLTTLADLAPQVVVLATFALPAGLFMFFDKESFRSVGISRTNLWQASLIGMGLALLTFYFQPGGVFAKLSGLTMAHGIAFVFYSFVGFGEEFLFRGYLQTRLVAWLGTGRGWLLASVIMALVHFPHRLMIERMDFFGALATSAALIPVSLLLGFVMLRTRNLVAPGLFHTFANWANHLSK